MTNKNYDILEKLTQGTDNVTEVTINVDDENITVCLRPLSSGELTKLRKIEKKPFTMKMNMNSNGKVRDVKKEKSSQTMDIGMADFTDSQAETMYTAVAWSMDIEVDAVKAFKAKGPLAPWMRPTKFPEIPVSLERNTEVFRHPLL